MPSTSSDAPAAAGSGTGALVPRSALRDGNAQERERMWSIGIGYEPGQEKMYPHRTPEGIMAWLKANPEVRTDSPAFPIPNDPNEKPEDRHWIFEDSLAYTVLKRPSAWKTPGLLEEVLRRIPDFERKDKARRTLFQVLKQNRKKEGLKKLTEEMQRRANAKENLPALAGLNQVARQKNLPDELERHIGTLLSGVDADIGTQRNTLRKSMDLPPVGKGRRKTRRITRNKSRRRGAQR